MARTVGKRTIKKSKPMPKREVNLFNMGDDFGDFEDPFDDGFIDDPFDFGDAADTTRDLTTVAVTLPLLGITTSLIGRL